MGSRRSYTVSTVVGTDRGLSPYKAKVTSAIKRGDAEDIAISSAKLVMESKETGDFFYGGLKLLEFLKKFEPKARKLSAAEVDKTLKKEWSNIKKKEKIRDDRAVDQAVLDAAKEALKDKK